MKMNKAGQIVFVVETSYQLFYSIILNYYFKKTGYRTTLVSACISNSVQAIARKAKCFDEKYFFDRFESKNAKKELVDEIAFIKKNKHDFKRIKCDIIIVFKDSNYIQGYLINLFKKKDKSKALLVEEGLSIYLEQAVTKLKLSMMIKQYIRINIMKIFNAKKVSYGFGYNRNLDVLAVFEPNKLPLVKKQKKILKLPNVAPSDAVLQQSFNLFSNGAELELLGREASAFVMYFGQPLSELSMVSIECEHAFLSGLNSIANTQNIKIVVKPHPHEKPSKYESYTGFSLIKESFVPAELIAKNLKPYLVITPFSSAAVNISRWWGVDCLYVFKLLDLEYDDLLVGPGVVVEGYESLSDRIELQIAKKESFRPNKDVDSTYLSFIDSL